MCRRGETASVDGSPDARSWKALPEAEQLGVRNFIVEVIIATASDEATARREKAYLAKLNVRARVVGSAHAAQLVLVQVLKQEWPQKWPNLCVASATATARLMGAASLRSYPLAAAP